MSTIDGFTKEERKQYGIIFTPEFVVKKTVDLAWKYIPEGVDKLSLTYCDPACGDGNFLEYVYRKLMEETSIADPVERSRHILVHCLWGMDILRQNVEATRDRLVRLHQETISKYSTATPCVSQKTPNRTGIGNEIKTREESSPRSSATSGST